MNLRWLKSNTPVPKKNSFFYTCLLSIGHSYFEEEMTAHEGNGSKKTEFPPGTSGYAGIGTIRISITG